jgi:hypothetical protein
MIEDPIGGKYDNFPFDGNAKAIEGLLELTKKIAGPPIEETKVDIVIFHPNKKDIVVTQKSWDCKHPLRLSIQIKNVPVTIQKMQPKHVVEARIVHERMTRILVLKEQPTKTETLEYSIEYVIHPDFELRTIGKYEIYVNFDGVTNLKACVLLNPKDVERTVCRVSGSKLHIVCPIFWYSDSDISTKNFDTLSEYISASKRFITAKSLLIAQPYWDTTTTNFKTPHKWMKNPRTKKLSYSTDVDDSEKHLVMLEYGPDPRNITCADNLSTTFKLRIFGKYELNEQESLPTNIAVTPNIVPRITYTVMTFPRFIDVNTDVQQSTIKPDFREFLRPNDIANMVVALKGILTPLQPIPQQITPVITSTPTPVTTTTTAATANIKLSDEEGEKKEISKLSDTIYFGMKFIPIDVNKYAPLTFVDKIHVGIKSAPREFIWFYDKNQKFEEVLKDFMNNLDIVFPAVFKIPMATQLQKDYKCITTEQELKAFERIKSVDPVLILDIGSLRRTTVDINTSLYRSLTAMNTGSFPSEDKDTGQATNKRKNASYISFINIDERYKLVMQVIVRHGTKPKILLEPHPSASSENPTKTYTARIIGASGESAAALAAAHKIGDTITIVDPTHDDMVIGIASGTNKEKMPVEQFSSIEKSYAQGNLIAKTAGLSMSVVMSQFQPSMQTTTTTTTTMTETKGQTSFQSDSGKSEIVSSGESTFEPSYIPSERERQRSSYEELAEMSAVEYRKKTKLPKEKVCVRCGNTFFESDNNPYIGNYHGACIWHTTEACHEAFEQNIKKSGVGSFACEKKYLRLQSNLAPLITHGIGQCGFERRYACCRRPIGSSGCWIGKHSDTNPLPDFSNITSDPPVIPTAWDPCTLTNNEAIGRIKAAITKGDWEEAYRLESIMNALFNRKYIGLKFGMLGGGGGGETKSFPWNLKYRNPWIFNAEIDSNNIVTIPGDADDRSLGNITKDLYESWAKSNWITSTCKELAKEKGTHATRLSIYEPELKKHIATLSSKIKKQPNYADQFDLQTILNVILKEPSEEPSEESAAEQIASEQKNQVLQMETYLNTRTLAFSACEDFIKSIMKVLMKLENKDSQLVTSVKDHLSRDKNKEWLIEFSKFGQIVVHKIIGYEDIDSEHPNRTLFDILYENGMVCIVDDLKKYLRQQNQDLFNQAERFWNALNRIYKTVNENLPGAKDNEHKTLLLSVPKKLDQFTPSTKVIEEIKKEMLQHSIDVVNEIISWKDNFITTMENDLDNLTKWYEECAKNALPAGIPKKKELDELVGEIQNDRVNPFEYLNMILTKTSDLNDYNIITSVFSKNQETIKTTDSVLVSAIKTIPKTLEEIKAFNDNIETIPINLASAIERAIPPKTLEGNNNVIDEFFVKMKTVKDKLNKFMPS